MYLRALKPCKYVGEKSKKAARIIPPDVGGFYWWQTRTCSTFREDRLGLFWERIFPAIFQDGQSEPSDPLYGGLSASETPL